MPFRRNRHIYIENMNIQTSNVKTAKNNTFPINLEEFPFAIDENISCRWLFSSILIKSTPKNKKVRIPPCTAKLILTNPSPGEKL